MCGRFSLTVDKNLVADYFDLAELEDFPARYNIAPTQPILVIVDSGRAEPGSNLPERRALLVRWGLIPSWVKDIREFPLLINARAETAVGKASFRAAMRHRRVLVPASGFYEWHRPKDKGEKPQAYWIKPRDGGVVAFAALMETYMSAEGSEIDTGAILTVAANAAISGIHDRMPVVIHQQDFARWLDCRTQEPREVADLLVPTSNDFFEAVPVADLVNKVGNTGPDLQVPVKTNQKPPEPKEKTVPDGQMSLF